MNKIVVVGGGFAGLRAAKKLGALLISDSDNFTFLPQLPELVNNEIKTVTYKLSECHNKVLIDKVLRINTEQNLVITSKKTIGYDYLVLATGSKPLRNIKNIDKYAISFHSINDVNRIKSKLPSKNIVIVGAGPTGVEIACELSHHGNVTLIDRSNTILKQFSEKTRRYAMKKLSALNVNIMLNTPVNKVSSDCLLCDKKIPYDLLVWTSGVQANTIEPFNNPRGIEVNEFLQVKGHKNIFAAGDCSASGAPLTAQAAFQEASTVANNINALINNKPLKKFVYKEKGKFLLLDDEAVMESFVWLKGRTTRVIRDVYYKLIAAYYRYV